MYEAMHDEDIHTEKVLVTHQPYIVLHKERELIWIWSRFSDKW